MQIYLETERLYLRQFTPADVDNLVDLDADPEVMRYLTGGRSTPRTQVEQVTLPRILGDYARHPGFGCWAAVEKASGAFVGWFLLRPRTGRTDGTGSDPMASDRTGSDRMSSDGAGIDQAELGYRLRRAAWGKGYATEGARALIRKGFTELGVRRIFAQTMQSWLVLDLTGSTQGRSDMPSFGPTARVKCPGRPRLPGHSPSAGSAP